MPLGLNYLSVCIHNCSLLFLSVRSQRGPPLSCLPICDHSYWNVCRRAPWLSWFFWSSSGCWFFCEAHLFPQCMLIANLATDEIYVVVCAAGRVSQYFVGTTRRGAFETVRGFYMFNNIYLLSLISEKEKCFKKQYKRKRPGLMLLLICYLLDNGSTWNKKCQLLYIFNSDISKNGSKFH